MAVIREDFNVMYLPAAIQRNNPIPLDSTTIWYDYDLMVNYAKNDPTAYVGQILSLVTDNVANAYIITNLVGDLEKVGSAVVTDGNTIVFENGMIAFKDFGKRYYRYIENKNQATYELQEVDEEHPWIAGLEPKVVSENGQLVLGWYEPNPTTIEGVNSSLGTIQSTVNDLQSTVSDLIDDVDGTKEALENVYTKNETNNAIAAALANASGLTYKKVSGLSDIQEDIDNGEPNVSRTIYLVPALDGLSNDVYDEYMVIDNVIERMGSWEVNLDQYATKEDLASKVDAVPGSRLITANEAYILGSIEEGAQPNYINEVSDNFVVEEGILKIVSLPTTIDLSESEAFANLIAGLENKVDKMPGKSLVADTLIQKLAALDPDGEYNVINGVSDEFHINEDRIISIVGVDGSKIINLSANAEFSDVKSQVQSVVSDIDLLNSSLDTIQKNMSMMQIDLNSIYADVETNKESIQGILEILTWQELEEPNV